LSGHGSIAHGPSVDRVTSWLLGTGVLVRPAQLRRGNAEVPDIAPGGAAPAISSRRELLSSKAQAIRGMRVLAMAVRRPSASQIWQMLSMRAALTEPIGGHGTARRLKDCLIMTPSDYYYNVRLSDIMNPEETEHVK